jgi:hypothetical protein
MEMGYGFLGCHLYGLLLAARRVAYEISMRDERRKNKEQKEAVKSQEASEKKWQDNVARLTKDDQAQMSIKDLKGLLVILLTYLAVAPDEESQLSLMRYISRLKLKIFEIAQQPLAAVLPPVCNNLIGRNP